jgi:periplasmic protein TonB
MVGPNNATYSPYGAYELKAKYQRNFAMATGFAFSLVAIILLTAWIVSAIQGSEVIYSAPRTIKTIAELGPPPTIVQKPPQVQVTQPNVAVPKVGIPTPVADEDAPNDDVVMATRQELADIVPPDVTAGGDAGDIKVDINEEEYLPAPGELQILEVNPEEIKKVDPPYPPMAKQIGLEGVVWIYALVDKDGSVREARVAKSSGAQSLDDAAVKAALQYQYKPGIQNGRPVVCWVTYSVTFTLDQQ